MASIATAEPIAGAQAPADADALYEVVNGQRVDSAMLRDGDVVTIGNIDLVFAGGTLARRNESDAATRTGGLDVHGVTWTIDGNHFTTGTLRGNRVAIVLSGVGMINAAMTTQTLVDHFRIT